eukprot:2573320-Prymnesium_polylepis.1
MGATWGSRGHLEIVVLGVDADDLILVDLVARFGPQRAALLKVDEARHMVTWWSRGVTLRVP